MKFKGFILILSLLCLSIKAQETIPKEKAVSIVDGDVGVPGSSVEAELKDNQWHIPCYYVSSKPPVYYVINAVNGHILLRLDNADDPEQKKKLKRFNSQTCKTERVIPEWFDSASKVLRFVVAIIFHLPA